MLVRCLVLLAGAALLSADKHHFEAVREEPYQNRSRVSSRATGKGDMVVEKFVETLMSSERYLKMIETVERKLNHLDAAFHERTNSIIKYLSELLRVTKSTTSGTLDQSLVSLKGELDKLKTAVARKVEQPEQLRGGCKWHFLNFYVLMCALIILFRRSGAVLVCRRRHP